MFHSRAGQWSILLATLSGFMKYIGPRVTLTAREGDQGPPGDMEGDLKPEEGVSGVDGPSSPPQLCTSQDLANHRAGQQPMLARAKDGPGSWILSPSTPTFLLLLQKSPLFSSHLWHQMGVYVCGFPTQQVFTGHQLGIL